LPAMAWVVLFINRMLSFRTFSDCPIFKKSYKSRKNQEEEKNKLFFHQKRMVWRFL
jgi:hypothetical protein